MTPTSPAKKSVASAASDAVKKSVSGLFTPRKRETPVSKPQRFADHLENAYGELKKLIEANATGFTAEFEEHLTDGATVLLRLIQDKEEETQKEGSSRKQYNEHALLYLQEQYTILENTQSLVQRASKLSTYPTDMWEMLLDIVKRNIEHIGSLCAEYAQLK